MKRELALHFVSTLLLLVIIILFKRWFNLSYWPLVAGGVLGTFLPDIDHLIYVYFLAPQELTSQRIDSLAGKRDVGRLVALLYETRSERKNLIFHSFYFQVIFLVLMFFVISTSASAFGRGLVGAFFLHFIVDQMVDLKETGNLDNWFSQAGFTLTPERARQYVIASGIVLLIFVVLL